MEAEVDRTPIYSETATMAVKEAAELLTIISPSTTTATTTTTTSTSVEAKVVLV